MDANMTQKDTRIECRWCNRHRWKLNTNQEQYTRAPSIAATSQTVSSTMVPMPAHARSIEALECKYKTTQQSDKKHSVSCQLIQKETLNVDKRVRKGESPLLKQK